MLTITDLFCGAGGSSSGAEMVPGVTVRMAANHWRLAVETHNINIPHADHDVADISQVDPRRYPTTDILWASPECTNHSQAKGRKRSVDHQPALFGDILPDEAAQRSRATMWDVLRFAERHQYRAIVVENVVDVRCWLMWPAWTTGLTNLGYHYQVVYLNSMFAQAAGLPAPQSRDRLYVVAWRAGDRKPDLARWTRPLAYCPQCDGVARAMQAWKRVERQYGRYRAQYVWRCPTERCHAEVFPSILPAAVAIDWQLPAERIGSRTRPLAPKTVARIEAGLRRYAHRAIHREAADDPLRTIHTTASKALACPPMVVPVEGREGIAARPAAYPMRTQTARLQDALVVPLRANNTAKPAASAPLDTVAAAGNHHAPMTRNNTPLGEQRQMSTPVDEPVRTLLAEGPRPSTVRWDHLVYGYDTGALRPVDNVLPTQTTVEGDAVLGPEIRVEDCTFRMLEPHEISAAMAFDAGYTVLGNKRERVRQLGNAVTPPAARDLIAAVVEAITGQDPTGARQ